MFSLYAPGWVRQGQGRGTACRRAIPGGQHAMRFGFGDCTLDTERYELRRAGQVIALEPRALRVLAYLLRYADRAVAKEELVQACWPGPLSEALSQEYALRNCLMKIRQAVGDAGRSQAVIATIRGY